MRNFLAHLLQLGFRNEHAHGAELQGEIGDGDLEHAMALIKSHKAIEATLERARHYGAIAKDELAIFQDSDAKAALVDVIDFCIGRVS